MHIRTQLSDISAPARAESAFCTSAHAHGRAARQWAKCFHWACWEWMAHTIRPNLLPAAPQLQQKEARLTGHIGLILAKRNVKMLVCWFHRMKPWSCLCFPPFPWLQQRRGTAANSWCCVAPSSSCSCRSLYRRRSKVPRLLPLRDSNRQPDTAVLLLFRPYERRLARFLQPSGG